ncbi:MAG: ABC transporter substrate-binding protein [Archangium sp.]
MRTLLAFVSVLLAGCSFTAAGNFKECSADTDCGALGVCSRGYCLTLPEGCRRESAGGMVDPFREATRIPLTALLPITNSAGGVDESELRGVEAMRLAISEVNDAKGLDNRHFALFVCDTTSTDGGRREVEQLEWMVKNVETPAVLCSGSDLMLTLADNPVRLDAGTFIISATATASPLSVKFRTSGNLWRVAPPDSDQARVMLGVLQAEFPDAGGRSIDVVHENSQYGSSFGNDLVELVRAAGYTTETRPFPRGADSSTIINLVRDMTNDGPRAAVVIAFPPDLQHLVLESQSYSNLTPDAGFRWFLGDAAKDPVITEGTLGRVLEGSYGTAAAQGAGTAFTTFRDAYKTRYGVDPLTFSYASHSYDATWLMMLSAAWASQNGATITGTAMGDGMARMQAAVPATPLRADKWIALSTELSRGTTVNVEGTSGPLEFDLDAGVPRSSYEVWQVLNGDIRVARVLTP